MPLRDHFRPPISHLMPWETLHSAWIGLLAERLNEIMPEGFVALDTLRVGRLEVDVATVGEPLSQTVSVSNGSAGGVAVAPTVYTPPMADGAFAVSVPDVSEIRVFTDRGGRRLVGAIELVSPGNKDRGAARDAFVAKCIAYLTAGVSLVVIDVVADRRGVLHNDILVELGAPPDLELPDDRTLYASAYRPVVSDEQPEVEVWTAAFAVGDSLPTMPFRLIGETFVPLELEATYTEACRRRRLL